LGKESCGKDKREIVGQMSPCFYVAGAVLARAGRRLVRWQRCLTMDQSGSVAVHFKWNFEPDWNFVHFFLCGFSRNQKIA
jgi:hypothetical protein